MDALFERDLENAKTTQTEEVFTTKRASENVREYFAEAVEAYLTNPNPDGGDIFRADNSAPGLKAKNPELDNYIEKIMTAPFTRDMAPETPARPLLPDFVPDPDAAVITLSNPRN